MKTRVFQNGNSQAVRIPKALQFERLDIDYEIQRQGDSLVIRPLPEPLTDVLSCFASFSEDFLAQGRPEQGEQERQSL